MKDKAIAYHNGKAPAGERKPTLPFKSTVDATSYGGGGPGLIDSSFASDSGTGKAEFVFTDEMSISDAYAAVHHFKNHAVNSIEVRQCELHLLKLQNLTSYSVFKDLFDAAINKNHSCYSEVSAGDVAAIWTSEISYLKQQAPKFYKSTCDTALKPEMIRLRGEEQGKAAREKFLEKVLTRGPKEYEDQHIAEVAASTVGGKGKGKGKGKKDGKGKGKFYIDPEETARLLQDDELDRDTLRDTLRGNIITRGKGSSGGDSGTKAKGSKGDSKGSKGGKQKNGKSPSAEGAQFGDGKGKKGKGKDKGKTGKKGGIKGKGRGKNQTENSGRGKNSKWKKR